MVDPAFPPNPFPYLGTLRLAGRRMEEGLPVVEGELRTLPREPIDKLVSRFKGFLRRFQPKLGNAGDTLVLRGPHGSGKTHTIFAAWETLASRKDVFPVYVLQQNADLRSLYAQVTQRLTPELLKNLSESLLGAITAEQARTDRADSGLPPEEGAQQLSAVLQADPGKAKHLLETYRVQEGATRVRQENALLDLTQGNKTLARIFQCLQGDQFVSDAAAWLMGNPVNKDNLRAMGVTEELNTPEQVSAALELLAALFAFAGTPLILFIDQFEKLLPADDAVLALANAGYLRSWTEAFVSRNAVLVLSGTEDAWGRLPEDARQRLALNLIDCPLLRPDEAEDIVRLYVLPRTAVYTPGSGSTHPFTDTAIRTMLSLGAGNPRRLLQLSYLAWQQAAQPGPPSWVIDDVLIRSIVRNDVSGQFVDLDRVIDETRRILSREPQRLVEKYASSGSVFRFALLTPDGTAMLLLDAKEAIFGHDEAANALLTAGTMSRLRSAGSAAFYAVVVCGYVSPEVVASLRGVVDELIVFTSEQCDRDIGAMLVRMRERYASVGSRAPVEASSVKAQSPLQSALAAPSDHDRIEDLLRAIVRERSETRSVVETREADSTEHFARQRYEERKETARAAWTERRRAIEDRISVQRSAAIESRLAEVKAAMTVANRSRIVRTVFLILIYLLAVVISRILPIQKFSTLVGDAESSVLVIGLAICIPWLLMDWLVFMNSGFADPPRSFADLLRISRMESAAALVLSGPLPRLARRSRTVRLQHATPQEFIALLRSEPISAFRQIYCQTLLEHPTLLPSSADYQVPRDLAEEWAILMQSGSMADSLRDFDRPPFDLVIAATGRKSLGKSRLALDTLANTSDHPILKKVLQIGLDKSDLTELEFLSEREIRQAVRELSPFEGGGVGTFQQLRCLPQIDYAFLLCSQLEFYFERDLLQCPPLSARKSSGVSP